jgi:hypothetical protein
VLFEGASGECLGPCGLGSRSGLWLHASDTHVGQPCTRAPFHSHLRPSPTLCPALLTGPLPPPAAEALVRSLQMTVAALPDLLPRVQDLLLDLLSLVLARRPFNPATPPVTLQALQAAIASGENSFLLLPLLFVYRAWEGDGGVGGRRLSQGSVCLVVAPPTACCGFFAWCSESAGSGALSQRRRRCCVEGAVMLCLVTRAIRGAR